MLHFLSWDRRPYVLASYLTASLALLAGCSGNPGAKPADGAKPMDGTKPAAPAANAAAAPMDPDSQESHPDVVPVQAAEANKDVVPVEGPIPLEPPDGKWLTDEFGRKYFVHKIAKVPQSWAWIEEGKKVQLIRGLQFDVVSYDDTSFDVKIYGTDAKMAADIEESLKPRVTPEALAELAATFKVAVAPSDRLRFSPYSQGLPQRGQWRNGFVVADINEDGKLDIVHGPPRKGGSRPAIFLGDGKGSWRPWSEASFPAIPFDYGDVAVADFNGDHHLDLVIASHLRGITVLVGDGKGRFSAWSQGVDFEAGDQDSPIFSSRAIEAVDWNGDGRIDVLAWGEGPRLAAARVQSGGGSFSSGSRGAVVYLNQGNGTWQKVAGSVKDRSYGDSMAVADFNQDGRPDFVAASALTGNRTILFLNQEDGSWKGVAIDQLRTQATFRGVAAGDFNRDGRPDLAVGYASNELGVARTGLDVLLAQADGSWERQALGVEETRNGIWALAAGDLDGDGAVDLTAITGAGEAWVFLGDGKGGFTREQSPELGAAEAGCTGYHAALTDLDGDGTAELIAEYAGEATVSPMGTLIDNCKTGGSLRAWKAARLGGR